MNDTREKAGTRIDARVTAALRSWMQDGEPLEVVIVRSKSMVPAIQEGDRVRAVWCPPESLHIGDPLLIDFNGTYFVHRLAWCGRTLKTRGDRSPFFDIPVEPSQVIGRVVAVERAGRWRPLPAYPWSLLVFARCLLRWTRWAITPRVPWLRRLAAVARQHSTGS